MRSAVWFLLLVMVLVAGCGESDKECVSREVRSCPCAGGAQGVQTCAVDGKSWSACSGCSSKPDAGQDALTPDVSAADSSTMDSSACGAGLSLCGKECVNLDRDPAHCGKCNTACKAGNVCSKGSCKLTCQASLTNCNGTCVNLKSDLQNCGGCGSQCAAGEVCSAGTCTLSCQKGLSKCGGTCVDVKIDSSNCGACNTACKAGHVCSAGSCSLSCQGGLSDCSGTCVNLKTDLAHCGACGSVCKAGQICTSGLCSLSCQSGLTNCSDTCVNLQTDLANCGYCATQCKAGQVCSSGKCAAWCQTGLSDCSGSCVDLKTDEDNCGACSTQCKQDQVCGNGICAASCGNNKVDAGEQCDGTQLWGKTCTSLGYYGGTLACGTTCSFDISGCHRCGDGKINGSEKCDGSLLGGKTCKSQGFDGGNLTCDTKCALVTSGCGKCSDKKQNGDEVDLDCGGSCSGCAPGAKCKVATDCKEGVCSSGVCRMATSCKDLHTAQPKLASGAYTIDPNGGSTGDAFGVWCEMSVSGGGWTLVMSATHTTKWSCGDAVWHDTKVDTFTVTPTKEGKSRAYTVLAGTDLLFKTHKEVPGRWAAFKMPKSNTLLQLVGTTNIQSRSNGYKETLTKVAVGSAAHACWNQTWRVTWKNYWSSDNYPDSAIFAPSGASTGRPCGGSKAHATGIGVRTDTNNGFSGYGGSFEGYGSDTGGGKTMNGGQVSIYIR